MGKRKRPKRKLLTQEEIWDDSALIQSWDDAVEEYNLYHSIQARGENVDDVLREEEARARAAEVEDGQQAVGESQPHVDTNAEPKPDQGVNGEEMEMPPAYLHGKQDEMEAPSTQAQPEVNHTASGWFANMPQLVAQGGGDAAGADEGLKNLMMAWYYAGYYTGLYEGQQRSNQRS
ncbi:hypothetical protein ACO22_05164 [Paracoccidioides brasiliensis]|uniref:Survival Motor Neuron Gemin2-binding domain-containing protein n=1 Tax=Paracoccidioides brasiliensis TaxID=121759 RepID=A0A1D2JB76_PARBR|nr:hypothetical protein ACO22_05164 [Paracoccidioides brasiliensis]